MKAKMEITRKRDDNWTFGTVTLGGGTTFAFEVKHYDEPSDYGIGGGRISKLFFSLKGALTPVVSYDRGWNHPPANRHHRAVLAALKAAFN